MIAPSARRRPRAIVPIVAIGIACMVALGLAELLARCFVPPEIVGRSSVRHDPELGRALIPGYSGSITVPGVTYRFSVNSLGFRGPEPSGPITGAVLFLGDSYSLGDGIDNGGEFPQIIARRINAPVVNASLAGDGQGRWIKILDNAAPAWSPCCVVLQFCSNDFRDNHEDRLFELDDAGTLRAIPVPPESRLRGIQRRVEAAPLVARSYLYAIIKRTVRQSTEGHYYDNNQPGPGVPNPLGIPWDTDTDSTPYDDLTIALTRAAVDRCVQRGWPVIGLTAQIAPGPRLDRLRAEFERIGAPFIVVPTKREQPDWHFTLDDHWNPAGHRAVADLVLDALPEGCRAAAHEALP